MNFKIIGTGRACPACVKTNDDLTEFLDTSDEVDSHPYRH